MSSLDDFFMWKFIGLFLIVGLMYVYVTYKMKTSWLIAVGLGLVVVVYLVQWKTGYISPLPRYRLF